MSQDPFVDPLDLEEAIGHKAKKERFSTIRFYLELIPISLLLIGVVLRYRGLPYWQYGLVLGGLMTGLVYLLFSRFLFKAEKQNTYEVILSVASGILIPIGILGVVFRTMQWDNADRMVMIALYGSFFLIFATGISFLFHLKDEQAGRFHRSLLARLLVFAVIVFRLGLVA